MEFPNIKTKRMCTIYMDKNQLVFISDLHLGDERFSKDQETKLLDFFEKFVEPKASRLIIVGDLFEMSQKSIQEILIRSRLIIQAIWELSKTTPIDYVVGNHDLFLSQFIGVYGNISIHYPSFLLNSNGYTIHLEHGHLYQAEYKENPELYNSLAKIGGIIDKIDPQFEDKLGSFLQNLTYIRKAITPTSHKEGQAYQKDLDDYRTAAVSLLDTTDFAVFGHTHQVDVLKYGVKQYINTGDWLVHANYVVFQDGNMVLYSWDNGPKAIPVG